ncbi:Smg-4/UPF3 family-domain-containing protein [Plectosphaerella cucumerina]|uniref:Smg-4/UPF3 family-domain-containing protein n=1 Tax=Plectosphaerella cucumerina TaxID=40658 RepID=A0A8K0T835_9PEZI|nr:Smg-4/UPF3 family-domain-containing protein [Plectosphaerella cucumerina]
MPTTQDASRRANGVLPMPASQAPTETPAATKSSRSKAPIEGDKVIIRRLPPGLTVDEFWGYLGDQWKVGGGLVDWFDFKKGKISQDPAKLSRPGRAYLHVMKRDYLTELSETVQSKTWEDAKATFNNTCLVGPPVLEFSIYKRFPGNKKRNDQRQGTIDQDPEFMAYLLSLTNPELDKEPEDKAEEAEADVKVTTTPLIEYLKEKKANKAKEAALAKSAKHARQESGTKTKGSAANVDEQPKRSKREREKESKTSKSADKPKETVKILTKKGTAAASTETPKPTETPASQSAATPDAPKSRRANIAAAARILQRDLGLSPGSAHRKARLNAAKSEAEAKASTPKEPAKETTTPPAPAPTPPAPAPPPAPAAAPATERSSTPAATKSGRSRRGGAGKNASEAKSKTSEAKEAAPSKPAPAPAPAPAKPVVLLKKRDKQETKDGNASASPPAPKAAPAPTSAPTPAAKSATPGPAASKASGGGRGGAKKGSSPAVTPGATRGFVKHANPSQGVTEALLKQALQNFGAVTFVEIDRRKGFAYVDFSEHESLVKAVTASPVTVAQGAVQILERKEKKPAASAASSTSATAPAATAAAKADKPEKAEKNEKADKAEKTEKTEQQQSSGARRNRRGRGGNRGGEGGKESKEGGRPAAAAKTGGASAGAG